MQLDGVRARHEAGGYGKADLEILLLGTRAQWAREHPPPRVEADTASASPRPMHNEGDSGNVVGDGNTGVRGVIRAADVGVGGVPAQVLRHLRLEATRTATPMVGINLLYGVESGRLQRLMRRLVETKASHWGRRYYICDASNHLSYDRPNRDESDDDRDANHRRSDGGHRCRDNQSRKEKQASETASTKDANSSGGNARGEEASCSMVGVVEPTILLALEAGKDFKAVDFALKENGVKLQDDGGEMLLVSSAGDVVARARYSGRVLYTNLRPCSTKLTTTSMEVVALRTIASATKSTPDMWHARLAYVGVDTIKSSAKHEIAASLDIKKPTADDLPCASCVGGKLAWHTFPVQGSDAENALDVVHIDLCGPFRVAANDGSFYFLLLKDRKTCYVWWHLALRQAVRVRSCLERASQPSGMTPHELLFEKKPDLTLARVWVCMVQFMVPEQQRGGKLALKARWGLHLRVSCLPCSPTLTSIDVEEVPLLRPIVPPSVTSSPSPSPPVVDLPGNGSSSAADDEGRLWEQFDNDSSSDDVVEVVGAAGGGEGELSIGEQFDDNDVVEVPGKAVKVAMDEEISSLISNGTWELAERPRSVNIMKNHWVLMTKYHVDDTVAREKARLVGKGFTQVYDADYDETPLLWYKALDDVLTGTGWKKSQVDEALYLKVGNDGVACWVLVYVNDLLDASSSTALLKELKELLEAAFELREISPVEKYLGLEIVCDRPAWKLWLHQQVYTLVSIDAYAELMFDNEEFQSREEEEHRQKIRSLQFAVTTTRLDIAFTCSKLGSGLTVQSDNHWREVGHCLLYLADTCDAALELGSGPETLDLVSYADADDTGDK
ncbi:unnamed protein product [Closterium sp. NIES-53]